MACNPLLDIPGLDCCEPLPGGCAGDLFCNAPNSRAWGFSWITTARLPTVPGEPAPAEIIDNFWYRFLYIQSLPAFMAGQTVELFACRANFISSCTPGNNCPWPYNLRITLSDFFSGLTVLREGFGGFEGGCTTFPLGPSGGALIVEATFAGGDILFDRPFFIVWCASALRPPNTPSCNPAP